MSVSRIPSRPNQAALDEQARIDDAQQHALHAHHARRKPRQYRHSTFRHGTHTKTVHGAAKAQHLLARMSASGVTHRRVAALHRDSDGKRGRDGGSHQQGKQQQGREKERRQQQGREQQQQQQQQQRRQRQRDGRPGSPPRAAKEPDAFAVRRVGSASGARASAGGDPVSDATHTAVHAPDTAALGLPMLRDDALRAASADRFFSIGESLRQGTTTQPSRQALSTTLDLLRARRDANFLSGSFDDNLAAVRQDLIASQARLGAPRSGARPGDRQASFNALLPLMVLSARRPLSGTLAERSMRHVQVLLRTPAPRAPGTASGRTQ
ncbi:hypothetical protein LL998_28830 [Burkholderia ambifaria]|uniref:hypothetical protein n=1 Tax=Burkholderia ambifaria TaxID=152480 RepID=UPI001E4D44B6|nr:hypothetical protein [Burkholderia ambifaria]UEP39256.1 hypothetical protein LL998_28830 [Burkholderia ambifaria]